MALGAVFQVVMQMVMKANVEQNLVLTPGGWISQFGRDLGMLLLPEKLSRKNPKTKVGAMFTKN